MNGTACSQRIPTKTGDLEDGVGGTFARLKVVGNERGEGEF